MAMDFAFILELVVLEIATYLNQPRDSMQVRL